MPGLDEQRRLVKRGQRLAREASVLLAQAADSPMPVGAVEQMRCTDPADAHVASARVERAIREHGQVDLYVLPVNNHGPHEGAQEDHHGA